MEQTSSLVTRELKEQLMREIPSLTMQIKSLYQRLDKQFGLKGANVPITFGYDTEVLGSYTAASEKTKEHFHFSLLFIGYLDKRHIHIEDKIDLFKHEYAHYMTHKMEIPKEHMWQGGIHGSAWKYCCSLIGAAPSAYYRFGQSREAHNYEKALYNPWKDPNYSLLDQRKQEKSYRVKQDSQVKYQTGDLVTHPKFGEGTVKNIEQLEGAVRLHIQFKEGLKKIDQKWLIRSKAVRRT